MSYKRQLKAKTIGLLTALMKTLVSPEQAQSITHTAVMTQLGKRSYYKNQETGSVHLGLCYKQVRKEVKKNPNVTVEDIKRKHKLA